MRRPLTLALTTLAVLVAGSLAPLPSAQADSAVVTGPRHGKLERMKLKSFEIRNEDPVIEIRAKIKKLHRAKFDAIVVLDTGYQLPPGVDGDDNSWLVAMHFRPSRTKGRVRLSHNADGAALGTVPCPAAKAKLKLRKNLLQAWVPQSCLGLDAGMFGAELYLPKVGGLWGRMRTGVLQKGPRGAAYSDVDGNGVPDQITQTSSSPSTYQVNVNTGTRTLTATAPRNDDATWNGAPPVTSLDIDHDGDAEVIGDPADSFGDGGDEHLFTVVGGELKLVRLANGQPFRLSYAGAGMTIYRDYRCTSAGLETWEYVSATKDYIPRYTVNVTSWSFASGTATPTGTRTVAGIPAGFIYDGNWSADSCATS